jgi:hypothetical protein
MKRTLRYLVYLVALAAVVISVPDAFAARPKKKAAYTPPPAPTPTPAPSVDLAKFAGANLDKILGPLDAKTPMPRAELAQIRASISARFSKASLAERPQFQAALAVCDALNQAMDERNKAMLNPAAANWTARSVQLRAKIEQLMANEKAAEVPPSPAH